MGSSASCYGEAALETASAELGPSLARAITGNAVSSLPKEPVMLKQGCGELLLPRLIIMVLKPSKERGQEMLFPHLTTPRILPLL